MDKISFERTKFLGLEYRVSYLIAQESTNIITSLLTDGSA